MASTAFFAMAKRSIHAAVLFCFAASVTVATATAAATASPAASMSPSASCAIRVGKAESDHFSKFEIATLCQGTTNSEETLKCVKDAVGDEALALTKMWIAQLCGRNGSPERVRCFRESVGGTVGMTRQEALELCRP
jgi:hypothetical protein